MRRQHCTLDAMPELPDISAYIAALEARIMGQTLEHIRVKSVFLLRSVDPPLNAAERRLVRELRRIGKRIAIGLDEGIWLVVHLMIAGRLHWKPAGAKLAGRNALAAFDFPNGPRLGRSGAHPYMWFGVKSCCRPWILAAWKYSRQTSQDFAWR
jgi:formamidopyrimidine-DNA glycosylase